MRGQRLRSAAGRIGAVVLLLAAALVPALAIGQGTASAVTNCTVTRGTDFSTVAQLQTILNAGGVGGCLATAAGDRLTVDFANLGTFTVTTTLDWSQAGNLTFKGPGVLDGQSARRILTSYAPVRIENLTMQNGRTTGFNSGGAVFSFGPAEIVDSTFIGNQAGMNGGAVATASYPVTVTRSTFTSNTATYYGGAIESADITVTGSTFTSNSATADGGALHVGGAGSISGSTFTGNQAGNAAKGGAVSIAGLATVVSSTFSTNAAGGSGALVAGGGSIADSTFTGNTAVYDAGAIYPSAAMTVTGSAFSVNTAGGNAGAIYAEVPVTITNSTLTGNRAGGTGGAIHMYGSAQYPPSPFSVTLNFVTVSGNGASSGANFSSDVPQAATVVANASVISDPRDAAGAVGGSNCALTTGAIATASVSSDSSCFANGGTNLVSTVAAIALGALGNNGGTTQTMLPSNSSVLVGHVATNPVPSVTVDQRGTARSVPMTTGAVEIQSVAPTTSTTAAPTTTTAPSSTTSILDPTTSVDPSGGSALPSTGTDSAPALGLGFVLLVGGSALAVLARRRRRV